MQQNNGQKSGMDWRMKKSVKIDMNEIKIIYKIRDNKNEQRNGVRMIFE
ncbi:unnamed protein product [Paramecium sonneborni]|uniref:Uncharacterized protein n=1 Tax=Paramecium sonneborni TaxID=65129 RepID=A0A8S1QWZ5_9CILI|nr:unnamed protein product [Paramecium sonneborni]